MIESSLLSRVPGIVHGFGNRLSPVPPAFAAIWEKTVPRKVQVHGADLCEVREQGQDCGNVDGVFTALRGVPMSATTADCVPVLLSRRDGGRVAAVHAGWRGTRARILEALWARLSTLGERPGDWVAAIGPAIGPCCYEVSAELKTEFLAAFPDLIPAELLRDTRLLDLPAINAFQLRALGVEVEVLRACTRCTLAGGEPVYESYRRNGAGTRQYSVVMRV